MNTRTQRGFTLVEVLIAAVIMFTVLATATLSLRSAYIASERAARVTELLAPMPWITPLIRAELRADPAPEREGSGVLFGVEYRFRATTALFGAPPCENCRCRDIRPKPGVDWPRPPQSALRCE